MVDRIRFEFVKYRNGYGSVGQCGNECNRPLRAVFPAKCNFIAFYDAGLFKKQMKFCHFSRNIAVLQRNSIKIGQRQFFPLFADGVFYNLIDV